MTKKIFNSVFFVAAMVLILSLMMIFSVLYGYFSSQTKANLKNQTYLIARALNNEGDEYLNGLDIQDYRITLIESDGSVSFDSQTDIAIMENHSDREEFIEALDSGYGESHRYSATLTEKMSYIAVRLDDNSVVRLSYASRTIIALALGMIQPLLILVAFALIVSAVLASRLSKRIVGPLNSLNLDEPEENQTYEELKPVLSRLSRQQNIIKLNMAQLEKKQNEWNAVTGSMSEGLILLGGEGEILSLNESAKRIFGLTDDAINEKLALKEEACALMPLLDSAQNNEHAETDIIVNEESFRVIASPIEAEGKWLGTALIVLDVTERIKAEQQRREFAANVSHELKTPLHSICGCAEIIKDGLVAPKDINKFINQIYSESKRMIDLVNDIIRISRLDEGIEEAPREEVKLSLLSADVIARLMPKAVKGKVSVSLSGDEGSLYGVRPLLNELIYNLIDNAIKYNKEDGKVEVNIYEDNDKVQLRVSDSGIGINEEDRDRIFERFYRVDKSHSSKTGGTGLGLSIVKHAAKIHDAAMEVKSEQGCGTTFIISFPKGSNNSHKPTSLG